MAKTKEEELNEIYLYLELGKLGKLSNKTLLEKIGMDYVVEKKQIEMEKEENIFPALIPASVPFNINFNNGFEVEEVTEDDK